jgi:hypothetical protein
LQVGNEGCGGEGNFDALSGDQARDNDGMSFIVMEAKSFSGARTSGHVSDVYGRWENMGPSNQTAKVLGKSRTTQVIFHALRNKAQLGTPFLEASKDPSSNEGRKTKEQLDVRTVCHDFEWCIVGHERRPRERPREKPMSDHPVARSAASGPLVNLPTRGDQIEGAPRRGT